MPEITIGGAPPAFTMATTGGATITSRALKGAPYVIYFYPKADTTGCTKQAQDFEENFAAVKKLGATIVGVSRDPMPALEKFAAKYGLTFPLGSDADGKVTEAFGVWVEKSMYGRKYMGIERTTCLVGADGRIAAIWPKVKVPGHVQAVLTALKAL